MLFQFPSQPFMGFTSESPRPPWILLTQVYICLGPCMARQTSVIVHAFFCVQPLAILAHILSNLTHYISGDYVLYIIVKKKCTCKAVCIVNILSQHNCSLFLSFDNSVAILLLFQSLHVH